MESRSKNTSILYGTIFGLTKHDKCCNYTVYARVEGAGGDFYLGLYNNKKWMHAMEVSG